MATVRFALVGVWNISGEHARLSGPPHHRDTLGKELFFSVLCMCALSLLWPERSLAKPPGLVCQEGGCILLLSGFQRGFDDGGLFLVIIYPPYNNTIPEQYNAKKLLTFIPT